jgi:rhamnose transport system permease protein
MTQSTDAQLLRPPARSSPAAWRGILATPELMVALLLVIAFAFCAASEKPFRDSGYLLQRSSLYMEVGMMAIGMTFVIIGGHIDLSCASTVALVGAVVTTMSDPHTHIRIHVPFALMIVLAPLLGAALGAVNGLIVAWLGLPSLVVTLATMAVYRGLAQVLVGDHSLPVPAWFQGLEQMVTVADIPMPLVIFLSTALLLGLVLHRTVYGRWIFAMGTNADAARYAGVPVAGVTVSFFVISGLLSSLASLMMLSRLHIARWDHANGQELDVITAVVLGGASIFGGRGTMLGTVMALALVAVMQTGMGVASVPAQYQISANGGLLIFAVLASNGLAWLRRKN